MAGKALITSVVFVISLSFAAVALAQTESPYMIMAQVGYTKLSVTDAPGGSFGLGGGVSYMLKPEVAIGAEIDYFNFGEEDYTGPDIKIKYRAIPMTGQIAYYVETQSNMVPYAGAGAGLYNLRRPLEGASIDGPETTNKFGTNFGGGIKFKSDNSISYGIDVRYHIAFQDEEPNWKMISLLGRLFF